jgi:hypothetical protein
MFGADHNAGGFESHIQTMRAESAFRGGVGFGVKIDRVVRAGLHAGFTSDANAWIKLNDAIVTLIHGSNRADAHAGRVDAMVAARHLKAAAHIGIGTRLDILDPRAIHTKRHLIFGFARGGTGVTSDTLALVDQKSIICH